MKGGIIQFREKQNLNTLATDEHVKIFAPSWVENALIALAPELNGARFEIGPSSGTYYTVNERISLKDLVVIARNERANTTGIIKYAQYQGIRKETIIALRDLVKHCVIVGKDIATHYGGYPNRGSLQVLNQEVYICDLPGLQFQELDNTGRHVILCETDFPKGALDNFIFENTVGEKKITFAEAARCQTRRYITGRFREKTILFDTKAFQDFVAQDFLLAAIALNAHANEALNFKFLKYGAGFFAEQLQGIAKDALCENLTKGVFKGIEKFFKLPPEHRRQIRRIELPFYNHPQDINVNEILNQIAILCQANGLEFASTLHDALAQTSQFKTATTNCSDPHAPTGNEMHYGSVDAAIAENLTKKGNNFNPLFNRAMQEAYIKINANNNILLPQIAPIPPLTPIIPKKSLLFNSRKWSFGMSLFTIPLFLSLQIFGFAVSVLAFISIMAVTFLGFELIRLTGNYLKTSQYQDYKNKTDAGLNNLNPTQLKAFKIGYSSAKSAKNQILGLTLWQAYCAPKAYYAGFQAKLEEDKVLEAKIRTRMIP